MPISFTCPHCGHATQAADQFAGQTGPCASCGAQVTIPLVGGKPSGVAPLKSSSGSSGATCAVVVMAVLGVTVVCGGILAALLLPAVQAAREAARRMECSNKLKQIAIAMHNYHDVYKTLPPAYFADEEGKPMRSWRASILPFVEQQPLYERYNFHERWDAPENQFAIDLAIPIYRCPSDPTSPAALPAQTNYVLLTGKGTMFEEDKQFGFRDVTDGLSNTIMAVEVANSGIKWSEPKDLDIEAFVAMFGPNGAGKRSSHTGGMNVAMGDGSVRFLSFTLDPKLARAMATKAGGEPVNNF